MIFHISASRPLFMYLFTKKIWVESSRPLRRFMTSVSRFTADFLFDLLLKLMDLEQANYCFFSTLILIIFGYVWSTNISKSNLIGFHVKTYPVGTTPVCFLISLKSITPRVQSIVS